MLVCSSVGLPLLTCISARFAHEIREESTIEKDINKIMWNTCRIGFHSKCDCDEIIEMEEVRDTLDYFKRLIKSMHRDSQDIHIDFDDYVTNFEKEVESYLAKIEYIEEQVLTLLLMIWYSLMMQ